MAKKLPEECCATCAPTTYRHADLMPLVNRIGGQVSGIGKMIEEVRYCPDILNQIRAARSALKTLESRILRTHLQSCVKESFQSGNEKDQEKKIEEIIYLFSRYDTAES